MVLVLVTVYLLKMVIIDFIELFNEIEFIKSNKLIDSDIEYVYKTLKNVANVDVYKKNDIPESLHYKNNVRIGNLIVVTKIGYALYITNQTVNWTLNSNE